MSYDAPSLFACHECARAERIRDNACRQAESLAVRLRDLRGYLEELLADHDAGTPIEREALVAAIAATERAA